MTLEQQFVLALRLMLAAVLSMLMGMERERRDKPAGLRTHMLVGMGACLFTGLSVLAFPDADSSRVASTIVTGVGFIGAGVIWRSQNYVHDLTTAASIWITAAVGMAVGTGAWFVAICATLLVWFILDVLRRIEKSTME